MTETGVLLLITVLIAISTATRQASLSPSRVTSEEWTMRGLRVLVAATVAAIVGLLGATTASAATVPNLETRVGASTPASVPFVGPHECITAGQQWGHAPPQAVSMVGSCVAAKAGGEGVDLFRHVSPGELADIQKSGVFRPGAGSMEGKWFAESAEHAQQWGNALNGGQGAVVTTRVPTSVADKMMRLEKLDGIGPASYADDLSLLNRTMDGIRVLP